MAKIAFFIVLVILVIGMAYYVTDGFTELEISNLQLEIIPPRASNLSDTPVPTPAETPTPKPSLTPTPTPRIIKPPIITPTPTQTPLKYIPQPTPLPRAPLPRHPYQDPTPTIYPPPQQHQVPNR